MCSLVRVVRLVIYLAVSLLCTSFAMAEVVNVSVVNHEFLPRDITINEGDTVRWTWGSDNHNVVSGLPFNSTDIFRSTIENTGFVFEQRFTREFLNNNSVSNNIYNYHCEPHAAMDMAGSITVTRVEKPLKAKLVNWQAVPKTTSSATGFCEGELNNTETQLQLSCSHNVVSVVSAEIRQAFIESNGSKVCNLGSNGKGTFNCNLSSSEVDKLLDGGMYVSINTAEHSSGEIRGQITLGGGDQTISGRVLTSQGKAVSSVSVTDGTRSDQTVSNGEFSIENVPNGVYQLTASKEGLLIEPNIGVSPVVVNGSDLNNKDFSIVGSNPLEGGNVKTLYPAYGTWNGFNQQLNVLECSNGGTKSTSFQLAFRDSAATLVATHSQLIPARSSVHLIINDLFEVENSYGTFSMEPFAGFEDGAKTTRCVVAVYRLSDEIDKAVEFAYVLPVENPTTGVSSGIFNSIDPDGGQKKVYNWLSLFNSGDTLFSAEVKVYLSDGSLYRSFQINDLAPLNRIDFALGHNETEFEGQVFGLYQIIPSNLSAAYGAFLTRYSLDEDGRYRYAVASNSRAGTCDTFSLFSSTMNPASNWLELANASATPVNVDLVVRNNAGDVLGNQNVVLASHQQQHILLNNFLGDSNTGTVELSCNNQASRVYAQGFVYGRSPDTNTVQWAYATQRNPIGSATLDAILPFNTYLRMSNWLKMNNNSSSGSVFENAVLQSDGLDLRLSSSLLQSGQANDFAVHESSGYNAVGFSSVGVREGSHISELLRVFQSSDGGIDYITRVPASLIPTSKVSLSLSEKATGLLYPIGLVNAADGSNRLFVVEQGGLIKILDGSSLLSTPFLDLSSKISLGGERGLLGLAFHPNFSSNGRFFVHYSGLSGETTIAEYSVSDNSNVADLSSERIILTVDQPYRNHNGGQIAFGPDGYLYIALGDGGSGGDPLGNGQNLGVLLGKLLRIDVDSGSPYAIPSSNPFANTIGVRGEIWAYGLRNPWRFSFDRDNGNLFLADVGQNEIEEIDLVTKGANYGWNTTEGNQCYEPAIGCDMSGITKPIAQYAHQEGISVVGGYVYRGSSNPSLVGKYIFGDFGSGRIWTLTQADDGKWVREQVLKVDFQISSFGEDEGGELYVVDILGKIYSF